MSFRGANPDQEFKKHSYLGASSQIYFKSARYLKWGRFWEMSVYGRTDGWLVTTWWCYVEWKNLITTEIPYEIPKQNVLTISPLNHNQSLIGSTSTFGTCLNWSCLAASVQGLFSVKYHFRRSTHVQPLTGRHFLCPMKVSPSKYLSQYLNLLNTFVLCLIMGAHWNIMVYVQIWLKKIAPHGRCSNFSDGRNRVGDQNSIRQEKAVTGQWFAD